MEGEAIAGEVVAFAGLGNSDGAEGTGFAVGVGVVFELDGLEGREDSGSEELEL